MPISLYILTMLSIILIICYVYIVVLILPHEKIQLNNWYNASVHKACTILEDIIGNNAWLVRYSIHTHKRLVNAGLDTLVSHCHFILLRVTIFFSVLVFLLFLYCLVLPEGLLSHSIFIIMIFGAYIGPDIWLHRQVNRWKGDFMSSFPFMLDLLVLSVRSGLTLTSAIDHSIRKISPGPVKCEFSKLLLDMRTGMSRKEALNAMSIRLNLQSVSNFVSVVNQIEITGGEISTVLSIQAKQKRIERFLHAEKLANEAPVKLLFPLIGLLFPVTMMLIILPVYIKANKSGVFNTLF